MDIFYFLQLLSDWLTFSVLMIDSQTLLAKAVNFFIYDTAKIFILLLIVTHLMSLLRFYLRIEKLRDFLVSRRFYGLDYLLASLFGAFTPFCSCSSIPLFIGFLEAGVPLGITFSFLITSPLINEIAVALFLGMFGLKVTGIYILAGIAVGIFSGFILGKLKMEKQVADFVWNIKSAEKNIEAKKPAFNEVIKIISQEAFGIIKKIALYIIIGVGIGAFIHGYVPAGFFENYLDKVGFWSVPLAVILAVPIYSNASGVIPIIQALVAKGIPLGTALAFMMAIVGLSLPEAIMLKKVLRLKLLLLFFGIVTLNIIILGYLFNLIF